MYFREKHCFIKKMVEIQAFDGVGSSSSLFYNFKRKWPMMEIFSFKKFP